MTKIRDAYGYRTAENCVTVFRHPSNDDSDGRVIADIYIRDGDTAAATLSATLLVDQLNLRHARLFREKLLAMMVKDLREEVLTSASSGLVESAAMQAVLADFESVVREDEREQVHRESFGHSRRPA
jgi:hypothetical protein